MELTIPKLYIYSGVWAWSELMIWRIVGDEWMLAWCEKNGQESPHMFRSHLVLTYSSTKIVDLIHPRAGFFIPSILNPHPVQRYAIFFHTMMVSLLARAHAHTRDFENTTSKAFRTSWYRFMKFLEKAPKLNPFDAYWRDWPHWTSESESHSSKPSWYSSNTIMSCWFNPYSWCL